jgi:hypothetical protein
MGGHRTELRCFRTGKEAVTEASTKKKKKRKRAEGMET